VISPDNTLYTKPGTLNGVSGTYEIGVRPSPSGRTEVITHRFFQADSDNRTMINNGLSLEAFGFVTAYDLCVLPEWSGSGVHQFHREPQNPALSTLSWNPQSKHKSVLIEVTANADEPWIGCFQPGLEGVSGLFATPSPERFCVVVAGEGYWVSALDPTNYELVRCIPIKMVHGMSEKGIVIFGSLTDLSAYSATGFLWETQRLSWDGLTITEVTEREIRGLAWDSPADCEVPFVVDIQTGSHQGGSSPEKYTAAVQ
jgi:hypothetical protein